MSEAPKKNYVFAGREDLEAKRLINQTSVRARMPKMEESFGANACWDGIVAPDGRFYYPLSSENGFCMHTNWPTWTMTRTRWLPALTRRTCFCTPSASCPTPSSILL